MNCCTIRCQPDSTSGRVEIAVASLVFVKLSVQCTPSLWNSSTSGKTYINDINKSFCSFKRSIIYKRLVTLVYKATIFIHKTKQEQLKLPICLLAFNCSWTMQIVLSLYNWGKACEVSLKVQIAAFKIVITTDNFWSYTHTLGVCLAGPFYQVTSPTVNSWELLWQNFYRLDALPVAKPRLQHHSTHRWWWVSDRFFHSKLSAAGDVT